MPLANGDTVMLRVLQGSGYAAPTKRLRGILTNIAGVPAAGDVKWENGAQQTAVPVTALEKIDPNGPPSNVRSFFFNKFVRFPFAPQEASGVVIDSYVAEEDDGGREGHIVVLLTGRGNGGFPEFVDINFGDDVFTGFETFFKTFGPDQHNRY